MEYRRLTLLNQQQGFLGLYLSDFLAALLVLVIVSNLLEGSRYQLLGFILPIALLIGLSPIRRKFRKKFVRDFITARILGAQVYDPRKA